MVSAEGTPILNEYDCPLLFLSNIIFTTKPSDILKPCLLYMSVVPHVHLKH